MATRSSLADRHRWFTRLKDGRGLTLSSIELLAAVVAYEQVTSTGVRLTELNSLLCRSYEGIRRQVQALCRKGLVKPSRYGLTLPTEEGRALVEALRHDLTP